MPVAEPQAELEAEEVERLIALAEQGQLEAADQRRVAPLLRTLLWLEHALLETRISLATLKRLLFGKPTEKTPRKPPADPPEAPDTTDPPNEAQDDTVAGVDTPSEPDTPAPSTPEPPEPPPAPGHGRLGAADYPGAQIQRCAHDHLHSGDRCPACARGRLYTMPPLVRLRFRGQPLVAVTRYELERLRCSACGMLFVAHLPAEVSPERYDTSLKVILAMAHYHLGLPFNRLESFQQMLGQPLPDATQWELVEQVADVGYVVFNHLQGYAAQLAVVFQDDTRARVLSLIKANQAEPPPARQAIYTTALRAHGRCAGGQYAQAP